MVYGILRLINFAHGDVFMVAGLMMVYLSAWLPLPISLPLMLLLTAALGFLIERAAYKPLRSAPRMSSMISAIGVSYLLQNLATYVTGGLPQMYPCLLYTSDIEQSVHLTVDQDGVEFLNQMVSPAEARVVNITVPGDSGQTTITVKINDKVYHSYRVDFDPEKPTYEDLEDNSEGFQP